MENENNNEDNSVEQFITSKPVGKSLPSINTDDQQLISESHDTLELITSYQIKPDLQDKFKESAIKEIIKKVHIEVLGNKSYDVELAKKWTISISNDVSLQVRDLDIKRYKHVVEVILGERKGQSVKSIVRCLWDSELDNYASDIFMNDSIFCVTTVFGVYFY